MVKMPLLFEDRNIFDRDLLVESISDKDVGRKFCLYIHVPFCLTRCGYCDFNTYTALELGSGASQKSYAKQAAQEIEFAARTLSATKIGKKQISSIFFGGGTPTILPPTDLKFLLATAERLFGFTQDIEITTEANPDSVTLQDLKYLARAGFTRVSFGMQSAVSEVLRVLERTHDPNRVPEVVRWAKDVGLQVSLDLIYGTPGESLSQWETSLCSALDCGPDHISAYALIVEKGTKLAAQIKRGKIVDIDGDDQAKKYELADKKLKDFGYGWYEISNWSKSLETQCRHNISYWKGDNWWGVGPGAHSHVANLRWWNVKHPSIYSQRIAAKISPALSYETLSEQMQFFEKVMLETRLETGLVLDEVSIPDTVVCKLLQEELVDPVLLSSGVLRLTFRGRLLADYVVRELTQ